MVDIAQYNLSIEEVISALIRQLGIQDGLWTLNVGFQFEAKNVKLAEARTNPGFVGVVKHVGLVRVTKSIPGMTVDAAKANPKPVQKTGAKLN